MQINPELEQNDGKNGRLNATILPHTGELFNKSCSQSFPYLPAQMLHPCAGLQVVILSTCVSPAGCNHVQQFVTGKIP